MTGGPELTSQQKAELLMAGIEAAGLDVESELDRISHLPPGEYVAALDEYMLAGLAVRIGNLPGGAL